MKWKVKGALYSFVGHALWAFELDLYRTAHITNTKDYKTMKGAKASAERVAKRLGFEIEWKNPLYVSELIASMKVEAP